MKKEIILSTSPPGSIIYTKGSKYNYEYCISYDDFIDIIDETRDIYEYIDNNKPINIFFDINSEIYISDIHSKILNKFNDVYNIRRIILSSELSHHIIYKLNDKTTHRCIMMDNRSSLYNLYYNLNILNITNKETIKTYGSYKFKDINNSILYKNILSDDFDRKETFIHYMNDDTPIYITIGLPDYKFTDNTCFVIGSKEEYEEVKKFIKIKYDRDVEDYYNKSTHYALKLSGSICPFSSENAVKKQYIIFNNKMCFMKCLDDECSYKIHNIYTSSQYSEYLSKLYDDIDEKIVIPSQFYITGMERNLYELYMNECTEYNLYSIAVYNENKIISYNKEIYIYLYDRWNIDKCNNYTYSLVYNKINNTLTNLMKIIISEKWKSKMYKCIKFVTDKKISLYKYLASYFIIQNITFNSKNIIPFMNGVYEIDTKIFRPHDKYDYITKYLCYTYNNSIRNPIVMKYLQDILPNKRSLNIILSICYDILCNKGNHSPVIFGGSKQSGRSTFIQLLNKVIGNTKTDMFIKSNVKSTIKFTEVFVLHPVEKNEHMVDLTFDMGENDSSWYQTIMNLILDNVNDDIFDEWLKNNLIFTGLYTDYITIKDILISSTRKLDHKDFSVYSNCITKFISIVYPNCCSEYKRRRIGKERMMCWIGFKIKICK